MSDLVLTAAAAPPRPFPRVAAVAGPVLVFAAALLRERSEPWAGVVTTAAVLAFCGLGTWLEDRVFRWARPRPPWLRLVIAAAVPPLALAALVPALVLSATAGQVAVSGASPIWVIVSAATSLWVASAGTGSLVVLVLDLVVSALVPDFKSRIVAAVFLLLTVVGAFAAIAGTVIVPAASALVTQAESGLRLDEKSLSAAQLADLRPELPALVSLVFAVVVVLLALPALLSACAKLADAVMERLHPLARGFELLSTGQLGVRVEEGGSLEFRKLNRAFNAMVEALSVARGLERTFGAYLGEPIVQRIRQQHGRGALPATQRDATVMFADIRGFTSMSEKLAPAQVMDLLNRYLDRAVAVVEQHEGYINKFIGDAIVVVFNGPIDQVDHARRGAQCALALQREVARLNAAGAFPEVGELRIGVGVATGPLVAGNLGGQRTEYTVIGDTVNLAARLTSHAAAGEIWVNEANARAQDPAQVRGEALAALKVKGKELAVQPYRLS